MSTLINVQPTSIVRRADTALFYFGVQPVDIYQLPGNTVFSVVHSPVEEWGWEFVRYQVFADGNGMFVVERRHLEADEIAYFEKLLANWRSDSGEK